MSKVVTILDLSNYVKFARELAVLGDYEKSLGKYKRALQIIDYRKNEVVDVSLRDKWINTENLIKNEVIMVHKAFEIAKEFQSDKEKSEKKRRLEEEENNRILMRDYDNNNYNRPRPSNNKYEYDPRWERFGGKKPFQCWEDGAPDDNPRPRVQKPEKNVNVRNQANVRKEYSKNVGFNKGGGGGNYNNNRNNYNNNNSNKNAPQSKQGKGPVKPGAKEGEKDPREGKSEFFLHHYPDGEGPDAELIEMVEREVMERNPNVNFDDIAELEGAKNTLKEAVLLPLLMPDFFRGIRRPWKGVLLYGPPGTGKTLLAKALATQGQTTFFNVSPTTFASKWRGESEKLVRILFEMARFYAPSTVFIDEVDSIGQKRGDGDNEASRKVMAEMLVQMDGVSGQLDKEDISIEELKKNIVMVLGATNLPWDLDDALRRRFEKRVYIPLPNSVGRREMFKINMKGTQTSDDVNLDELIKLTDGYSGADIANVCREAALMNMRRKLMKTGFQINLLDLNPNKIEDELNAPVTHNDFVTAIKNISKSVSNNDIKKFENWSAEYSSN